MANISAVVLILGAYNFFFFPLNMAQPGRLEFVLAQSVLVIALWLMFSVRAVGRLRGLGLVTSLVTLFTAAMSVFEASELSAIILGIISVLSLVLTTYLLMLRTDVFGGLTEALLAPIRIGLAWVKSLGQFNWGNAFSFSKSVRVNDQATKIIRGLLMAAPVLFIVIGLLSSADPIFNELVQTVFRNPLPKEVLARIFYSSLLLIGLLPFTSASIRKKYTALTKDAEWKKYPVESMVVIGLLAVILGSFLVIQFRYLVATVPETQLHQFGINTYSEYVRKGFVEMVFVAGIVYVISAAGYLVYRSGKEKWLRLLNLVLIAETALFTVSIFRRVYLYALHHGLTRIRIFGSAFVVYVLILIVVLGLRHITSIKKPWYLVELGMAGLLVILVTAIKPDYLIATRFPPTVNNEIDYVYIARLSADALPGWVRAYRYTQEVYKTVTADPTASPSAESVRQAHYASLVARQLLNRHKIDDYKRGWLAYNFARRKAYQQLKQSIDLNELTALSKSLEEYLNNVPPEMRNLPFDRSTDSPLL